ncbi:MAG: DNA primase [Thermoanaerobaculales bacterium]
MSQYDLSRAVLERVREAADIVAVVGEHLTLKKSGRNYMGLCPFHGEKTPSFSVSREKGTYYCFGCKRGGDVIDFVMEIERLPFAEAVERLADHFGVSLPPASPEAGRRRGEEEQLVAVLEAAQAEFSRHLGEDRPRAFLERRGVTLEQAAVFGLGYAPAEWRGLLDRLRSRFPERVLLDSGIAVAGEGGKMWDRFRDRVTIPIRNPRGRLIAFGGRTLGDDPAKYLNSPETSLFSKSHVLFALDRAARAFAQADRAIVVEGYFDCLALHLAGFAETVATLGTSLSEHHAKELARRAPQVVVCFDGDDAGRRAAATALRTLLGAALEIKVLLLPQGQDPDDVVRREGAQGFQRRLDGALSATEFLLTEMGESLVARRRNLIRALEIVDACADPVRRYSMREALARGAGVPLERLSEGSSATRPAAVAAAELPPAGEKALLRLLLLDLPLDRRADFLAAVPLEAVGHLSTRTILAAMLQRAARGETLEISGLTSDIEDGEARRVMAALEHEAPSSDEERFRLTMRTLWEKHRKMRLAELSVEITRAEQQGDQERLAQLKNDWQTLLRKPSPT